jgi:hypothetical protein
VRYRCWRLSRKKKAVFWACDAANGEILRLLRPAAQLSTALNVGLVIDAVEQWQKAATNAELSKGNADVLAYLRSLSAELSAASGAAVQLAAAESKAAEMLKVAKACCICFDDIAGPSLSCSSGSHHMCMACLEQHAAAESESSKQRIAANNGKLGCPGDGCTDVFQLRELAQHLSDEAFSKLLAAWQTCIEQAAMQTAAEQAQQELARAAAQDEVSKARAHVTDSILTLKCPRCSKAFDDFTGCLALTCGDAHGHGCGAKFCGYCLEVSDGAGGMSHHAHVASCAYSIKGGAMFGSKQDFDAAQCRRRKRLVQEYLATLPLQLRDKVEAAIAPDLKDLGIDLKQVEQQQQQQQGFSFGCMAAAAAPDPWGFGGGLFAAFAAPAQQQQQQQQGFTFGRVAAPAAAPQPWGLGGELFGGFAAPWRLGFAGGLFGFGPQPGFAFGQQQ